MPEKEPAIGFEPHLCPSASGLIFSLQMCDRLGQLSLWDTVVLRNAERLLKNPLKSSEAEVRGFLNYLRYMK